MQTRRRSHLGTLSHWFPVFAASSGHSQRFHCCPNPLAPEFTTTTSALLAPGTLCFEPRFYHGVRFSRQHRPSHGHVSRRRRLHGVTEPSLAMRNLLRPKLSDQNHRVITGSH